MIGLNRERKYVLRRYLLLMAGLSVMAFGVAFSIKADLGTSPISSVPYVVSLFAPLTVGTATIVMHCVFILLQILILRKDYHPIQLMQLPVAFFFGYLTDFGVWAVQGISYDNYWQQWILCLIGILLVAVGVSMEVKAGVVVLAGFRACGKERWRRLFWWGRSRNGWGSLWRDGNWKTCRQRPAS